MSFYELLAVSMERTGITAAELSRRTGLSQSYFSNLKKGSAKDVTWEKALLIINALGMKPSEFLSLGDERGESE